jgi:peroxiredoxin
VSSGSTGFRHRTRRTSETAERLHLPFPLLSDEQLEFARALRLPTFQVGRTTLLKRCTLVVDDGRVAHVFYPVFPPDRNADRVIAWLTWQGHQRRIDLALSALRRSGHLVP